MLHRLSIKKIKVIVVFGLLVVSFQNCSKPVSQSIALSSSSPLMEIDQDPAGMDASVEGAYNLLMDRKMIYSLFQDILGNSSQYMGSMRKLKFERGVLGGSCSLYETFRSQRVGFNLDLESDTCINLNDASNVGARVEPSANELQEAVINDVCVEAGDNNQILGYVISQLKEDPNVSIPSNTDENVLKLISLFYRGKPMPPAKLIQALRAVLGNPATDEGWKRAFLTTCTSVHWQTL